MGINKEVYVPLLISLVLILGLLLGSPSPWITGIFTFFLVLSLMYYFFLYPKGAISSVRLAQLYYVAVAIQCIHFVEEYLGALYIQLPALFELPPITKDSFVIFNLVVYAIFILGGITLIKNLRSFMVIPIFFILFGVVANGVIHVLLALWNGAYFPGLYTALLYLVLAPVLLRSLHRRSRDTAQVS